jgi:hypothetical protein
MQRERHDQHGWRWVGMGITTLVLLVCVMVLRPPPPLSHWDAVAELLHRREVAYRDIIIDMPPQPPTGACTANDCAASIVVVIEMDRRSIRGRILCRDGEEDCVLSVPTLDIYAEPLPELRGARHLPQTLDDLVRAAQEWARRTLTSGRPP